MSVYDEREASKYDHVIGQLVYKYYVAKKLNLIEDWFSKESTVLDVGCGTGVYTTALSSHCSTIVGSDISPEMVARGIARARAQCLNNIHFVVCDVAHIPFRERTFDLVFSVNLFHHIVNQKIIRDGFLEQERCNKPGGRILVFELNPNSLGWSTDVAPKIVRGLVYLLLFPLHQNVIDNVEEGTRILSFTELTDGMSRTRLILRRVGGFIPTYCPSSLFKIFVLLEKAMEAAPLLRRYGAHILLVGEVR
jgi:ubiquinone/menaquinone biosynthesis C-methylase UbiE